ncbi:MAG TPA: lysine--tRNA ligase [Gemmatales bacterium]|nr:lysine--tRNA ligase [Gemmatales bacterium]
MPVTADHRLEADRLAKLEAIAALGVDPWGRRFDGAQPIADVRALPITDDPMTGPEVRAAGRIFTHRKMGKIRFLDLVDRSGRIQVMVGQKQVDETSWAVAEQCDLGDLLAVVGRLGTTKAGELTIFAQTIQYQGKALLPHPDKWSGIEDTEFALRHRYLDFIYDPELRAKAVKRVQLLQFIRTWLAGRGFLEVETPVLQAIAGGAAARPFKTHHNALDIPLFLRIALELPLKKLLVAGFERVFEMSRVFRNEGISPKHNPEFTMLELYEAHGDYETMMELTESLIVGCVQTLGQGLEVEYGDVRVDFTPPWRRAAYGDLFREFVGVEMMDTDGVAQQARSLGIEPAGKDHDVLVHLLFEHKVEGHLHGPIFVFDYPAALCPLTKRKAGDPRLAERFELYVNNMELANAYTELNDPITQEATFRRQLAGLPEEESMAKMDDEFVKALKYGMPPAGGMGMGIDRLVMLLTNSQTIREVILFPLLRPELK